MKIQTILNLVFIFIVSNSLIAQLDSLNAKHARTHFEKLTSNNALWVAENEKFDPQNENDFSAFILEFKNDGVGGMNGIVSGINQKKDTVVFWKFLEFIDPYSGKGVFIQRSKWAFTISSSEYPNENERIAEFELKYYNGAKEKHRDIHTFIDENSMTSKSEIFDEDKKKWIKQPTSKWIKKYRE